MLDHRCNIRIPFTLPSPVYGDAHDAIQRARVLREPVRLPRHDQAVSSQRHFRCDRSKRRKVKDGKGKALSEWTGGRGRLGERSIVVGMNMQTDVDRHAVRQTNSKGLTD